MSCNANADIGRAMLRNRSQKDDFEIGTTSMVEILFI